MLDTGTVTEPDMLKLPDSVSIPVVTEIVLVENVLVVTALVEPVSVGSVGRGPLPDEVRDPKPLVNELGKERDSALLPPELTGLTDVRTEVPRPLEGGREPEDEPGGAGGTESLGGGAP